MHYEQIQGFFRKKLPWPFMRQEAARGKIYK